MVSIFLKLYDVDETMLSVLDGLERHPDWYLRSPIQVCRLEEGANPETVDVYLFLKERHSERLLEVCAPLLSEYSAEISKRYILPRDRLPGHEAEMTQYLLNPEKGV